MKLNGFWSGEFRYRENQGIPGSTDPVPFTMRLRSGLFGRFSGSVKEDEASGGQPELGSIKGKYRRDHLTFCRTMPAGYAWLPGQSKLISTPIPGPHRVHYEGILARLEGDSHSKICDLYLTGTWWITGRTIHLDDGMMQHRVPTSGTWSAGHHRRDPFGGIGHPETGWRNATPS